MCVTPGLAHEHSEESSQFDRHDDISVRKGSVVQSRVNGLHLFGQLFGSTERQSQQLCHELMLNNNGSMHCFDG